MRNLDHLNKYRANNLGNSYNGAFKIKFNLVEFFVIASNGGGWDHVSVSAETRCPRWYEMQKIKEMFFEDGEVVMQLHPAKSEYVNIHPNCLHMWRPHNVDIPTPPIEMV